MELSLDAVGMARAVLIAGPTASGKSALALSLAEEAKRQGAATWIVNADAMQVYEGLRILTARPSADQEARVPHYLYGRVSPAVRYSVGAWLNDVSDVIGKARAAGALAIVVGGTGLYFKALTEGLAATPDVPPEVRARWETRLASEGAPKLHEVLAGRDPDSAAAIRPSDPQRILRALEVFEATGRPLSEWQRMPPLPPVLSAAETAAFVVETDRVTLYRRIEERFERMVEAGALDEVRTLLGKGLDPELPAMKAIGVREFSAVIRGEVAVAAAVEKAKTESRRYAKRQTTWFRHQMPDWRRIEG
jgi:tRNA dimethylallyltransferase